MRTFNIITGASGCPLRAFSRTVKLRGGIVHFMSSQVCEGRAFSRDLVLHRAISSPASWFRYRLDIVFSDLTVNTTKTISNGGDNPTVSPSVFTGSTDMTVAADKLEILVPSTMGTYPDFELRTRECLRTPERRTSPNARSCAKPRSTNSGAATRIVCLDAFSYRSVKHNRSHGEVVSDAGGHVNIGAGMMTTLLSSHFCQGERMRDARFKCQALLLK